MTAAPPCTSCGRRARHTARNGAAPYCRECLERGHDLPPRKAT